jgi:hypothetical protein
MRWQRRLLSIHTNREPYLPSPSLQEDTCRGTSVSVLGTRSCCVRGPSPGVLLARTAGHLLQVASLYRSGTPLSALTPKAMLCGCTHNVSVCARGDVLGGFGGRGLVSLGRIKLAEVNYCLRFVCSSCCCGCCGRQRSWQSLAVVCSMALAAGHSSGRAAAVLAVNTGTDPVLHRVPAGQSHNGVYPNVGTLCNVLCCMKSDMTMP